MTDVTWIKKFFCHAWPNPNLVSQLHSASCTYDAKVICTSNILSNSSSFLNCGFISVTNGIAVFIFWQSAGLFTGVNEL